MADEMKNVSSYFASETKRVFSRASAEKRQEMYAAERRKEIFKAWNEAIALDRRGVVKHVTGLYYHAPTRVLTVYIDTPAWCQELLMQKHIFMTRMAEKGASVEDILFKVSKTRTQNPGFHDGSATAAAMRNAKEAHEPKFGERNIENDLTPQELEAIHVKTQKIKDEKLRNSIEKAMISSFALEKCKEIDKKS